MNLGAWAVAVADKPVFDGQQQRQALEALQKAAGIDATAAARSVGLSYPQYNRYLWGRVPLRTDQIRTFAQAYGVTTAALTRALGLLDDEPDAVLLARVAEALGACSDDATARAVERELTQLAPRWRDELLADIAADDHDGTHS